MRSWTKVLAGFLAGLDLQSSASSDLGCCLSSMLLLAPRWVWNWQTKATVLYEHGTSDTDLKWGKNILGYLVKNFLIPTTKRTKMIFPQEIIHFSNFLYQEMGRISSVLTKILWISLQASNLNNLWMYIDWAQQFFVALLEIASLKVVASSLLHYWRLHFHKLKPLSEIVFKIILVCKFILFGIFHGHIF